MNSINIKVNLASRLLPFLLCLLLFTLPIFIPNWHGKIIIIAALVWIFTAKRNQVVHLLKINRQFQLLLIFIFISMTGLLYSTNTKAAIANLESLLPLCILPLIIFSSDVKFDKKVIHYAFICFVTGVITLNLASLTFISYDLWDPINLQSNIILANNAIFKIHPVFLSLYISFSIFFLVDQFFPLDTTNRSKTGWILFGLVILIVYLIWINSRTGILTFFVGSVFYIFYKFRNKQRYIFLFFLGLVLSLIIIIPFSRERFLKAPLRIIRGEATAVINDRNTYTLVARKQILNCSLELVRGKEFFLGYGTGDYRDKIMECYKEKGYEYAYKENLDSHNEYFAQLHSHGIIGVILFVMLLVIPFRQALKYKSALLAVFIILFSVTAIFENVLSAQKGVTFFSLMCPLLMLLAKRKSEDAEVQ